MSTARSVVRPSIPPLAWVAAALWAGLCVAEGAVWDGAGGAGLGAWLLPCAVACVMVVVAARLSWLRLPAIGLCLGLSLGALYWGGVGHAADALTARAHRLELLALQDARAGSFGLRQRMRIAAGQWRGSVVDVTWPADATVPELGQRVAITAVLRRHGGDEWGRRAHRDGSVGSLQARAGLTPAWSGGAVGAIGKVRARAISVVSRIPGEGGALLAGVVLGDCRRLEGTQVDGDFKTCGLTHLIAVSGGHLVVVAAVVASLLATAGLALRVRRAAVLGILVAYVIGTGLQSSAVRAVMMAGVVGFALDSGRRADGANALAAAVCIALVTGPASVFDLGFRLSVASVAALVAFAGLARAWALAAFPRALGWLAEALALTTVAQLGTLPVSLPVFSSVSLVAPAANVVAVGPISVVLIGGLVGVCASCVHIGVADLVLSASAAAGNAAAEAAHLLAGVDNAMVLVGARAGPLAAAVALVGAAVWAWWPAPSPRIARGAVTLALVAGAVLAVGRPVPSESRIVVLDVGQGDAILVSSQGASVLVDTGPSTSAIRAALARYGVRRLDAVFVSHPHADHAGGLEGLAGAVGVQRVLVQAGSLVADPAFARKCAEIAPVDEVVSGDAFTLGSLRVEVVSPPGPVDDPGANDNCAVIVVRQGDAACVLTGDAERGVLERLTRDGSLGDIDVLKVGHHGSADAVSPEVLGILQPEVAVISVGAGNRFGHPVASTLRTLREAGVPVARTDRDGDIELRVESGSWRPRSI